MKRAVLLLAAAFFCAAAARADFVILRDGRSYSGAFTGAPSGNLTFTDTSGIQYTFPVSQVQTLVFSNLTDHISLRNGQSYTGHLTGAARISFRGSNGVGYVFPLQDVSSLVFTHHGAAAQSSMSAPSPASSAPSPSLAPQSAAAAQSSYASPSAAPPPPSSDTAPRPGYVPPAPANASYMASSAPEPSATQPGEISSVVIPSGTQIVVQTDTAIDTATDAIGRLYPAKIEQDVVDSTGAVGIPAGTSAELKVINLNQDTTAKNPDLALDLHSVMLNGKVYRVDTSSVAENGSAGYGMNKRTAEYTGGGAGLGALLGAVFGGGKGAGIGVLAGGAAGAIGQYLTRGKRVNVPAESALTFQLQKTMVLHP
jgi:hypothetical protein